MLRPLVLSLASFILVGCATTYVPTPGASTARVKFVADPGSNNNAYFLSVKPGPECRKTVGQSLARLGAAINRDGKTEHERDVESGDDIRVFAHWIETFNPYSPTYSCKVGAIIGLLPDHRYELRFNLSNPCSLELFELDDGSGRGLTKELPVVHVPVQTSRELCDVKRLDPAAPTRRGIGH